MRTTALIIIVFGLLIPVLGLAQISVERYENDNFKVELKRRSDNIIVEFDIQNKKTHSQATFTPELIEIDGTVPEGSLRLDYNLPDIFENWYQCDSTYSIEADSASISFALEVVNHKRMEVIIWESNIQGIDSGSYTLYQQHK